MALQIPPIFSFFLHTPYGHHRRYRCFGRRILLPEIICVILLLRPRWGVLWSVSFLDSPFLLVQIVHFC